jgi:hypothetical protein
MLPPCLPNKQPTTHRLRAGHRGRLWIVQGIGSLLAKVERTGPRSGIAVPILPQNAALANDGAFLLKTIRLSAGPTRAAGKQHSPETPGRASWRPISPLLEGNVASPGRKHRVPWKETSRPLEGNIASPGRKHRVPWKETSRPLEGNIAGAGAQKARRVTGITRRAT